MAGIDRQFHLGQVDHHDATIDRGPDTTRSTTGEELWSSVTQP